MLRNIFFYFQRTSKFFRESLGFLLILFKDYKSKKGSSASIRVAYNGYPTGTKKEWLYTFLQELTGQKVAVSWYKPSVIFSSSFGSYWLLKIILGAVKAPSVFFSEENLATLKKYREYKTYLDGQPTLAMGFDYCSAENYRRFPLWLMYIFSPEFSVKASVDDIQERLNQMEKQSRCLKSKFTAMVASHDGYASKKKVFGCLENTSRSFIAQKVSSIDFVHCPGRLMHNDDSLKKDYNDDKISYLNQFLFNICAENASVKGYVTEKIFQAIEGGTIPIYWGGNNPEPGILNQQRIIFWNKDQIEDVLEKIKKLYFDMDTRKTFIEQPVFIDGAAKKIHHYFELLRSDLDMILADKNKK